MNYFKKTLKALACFIAALVVVFFLLSYGKDPEHISYGVSFSQYYSEELGLSWKDTLASVLDELRVRKLRLSAYWPRVEPERKNFQFTDLDFQVNEAKARNVEIILAVGRRLPRWPECHIPDWVKD